MRACSATRANLGVLDLGGQGLGALVLALGTLVRGGDLLLCLGAVLLGSGDSLGQGRGGGLMGGALVLQRVLGLLGGSGSRLRGRGDSLGVGQGGLGGGVGLLALDHRGALSHLSASRARLGFGYGLGGLSADRLDLGGHRGVVDGQGQLLDHRGQRRGQGRDLGAQGLGDHPGPRGGHAHRAPQVRLHRTRPAARTAHGGAARVVGAGAGVGGVLAVPRSAPRAFPQPGPRGPRTRGSRRCARGSAWFPLMKRTT